MGCPTGQVATSKGVCVEIRGKSHSTDLNWTGASNQSPSVNHFAAGGRTSTPRNKSNSNRQQINKTKQMRRGGSLSKTVRTRGKRRRMFGMGGSSRRNCGPGTGRSCSGNAYKSGGKVGRANNRNASRSMRIKRGGRGRR